MPNPVVTAKSIRWDCNIGDIFIEASNDKYTGEWTYVVLKNRTAIIPKIKSSRAPDDNSPRGRDSQIRSALGNQTKYEINIDDVMKSFFDFSVEVGNNPSIVKNHITPSKKSFGDNNAQFVEKAVDVLSNGDPVKYLLDAFSSMHKGDRDTAMVLLVSIATQSILNSDGIHPTLNGESGKGKSHVCKTVLHLVPEEYWIDSSLSAKAMFYTDIKPGTIIFSDDVQINEDLESTIKRSASDFQSTTIHMTVDSNRRGTELKMPPRISWWLSNVDSEMSTQMINRQFGVTIDETSEMDNMVRDFQLERAMTGEVKFPMNDEISICREIMRIIKETATVVTIPFAKNIEWQGAGNRRNLPIFLDIIKAFAVMRFKQRTGPADGKIEATIDDFDDALQLYANRAETQTTKLNDIELKLIHILSSSGDMDTTQLQKVMGVYQTKIHNLMHGRDGKSGLLSKVPELRCEKATVPTVTDNGLVKNVQKNIYSVHGFNIFESYNNVVSLNKNGDTPMKGSMDDRIEKLMNEFKESSRYDNTDRGFSIVATKLEDEGFSRDTADKAIKEYRSN